MGSPQKAAGGIGKVTLPCRYRTDAGVPRAASEAAPPPGPQHARCTHESPYPSPAQLVSLDLNSMMLGEVAGPQRRRSALRTMCDGDRPHPRGSNVVQDVSAPPGTSQRESDATLCPWSGWGRSTSTAPSGTRWPSTTSPACGTGPGPWLSPWWARRSTRHWRTSVARLGPEQPPGFDRRAQAARQLLAAYVEWAPGIERLAPVLVEVEYAANLADPEQPDGALFTRGDEHVSYRGRVDLLGVDEYDAYWIMRHRVVREWTPLSTLRRDEEALAACWAWPQHYIGMEIAGTIHNEMRLPTAAPSGDDADPLSADGARPTASPVRQHEGSGGGRSVPRAPATGRPRLCAGRAEGRRARHRSVVPPHLDPAVLGGDRASRSPVGLRGPRASSTPKWRSFPRPRRRLAAVARSPRRVWPSTREKRPRPRPSSRRAIGRELPMWSRGASAA